MNAPPHELQIKSASALRARATVTRRLLPIQPELPSPSTPIGDADPFRVRARFGSYRGFVRLLLGCFENGIGGYRRLKRIRWDRVERVVFVCHGNMCRSPYAERRAATYGLLAASFGLSAETGAPADPSALKFAAQRAIGLAEHRACAAKDFKFHCGDLLIVMEPRQARAMSRCLPMVPCQLTLLGLWSRPRRPHIHDPYRLCNAYWEQCFDVIDSAVRAIAERTRLSPPNGSRNASEPKGDLTTGSTP
jgi:protein-tyrosine phosphatase